MGKRKCLSCNKVRAISYFKPKTGKFKCRMCVRISDNLRRNNLANRYRDYKFSAKRRGFAFDLTKEQFKNITSKKCHYCGGFSGKYENERFNGVDRMNGEEGYYEHNCVPCCMTCNCMKLRLESDDFIEHAKKIFRYQNKVGTKQ